MKNKNIDIEIYSYSSEAAIRINLENYNPKLLDMLYMPQIREKLEQVIKEQLETIKQDEIETKKLNDEEN